MKPGVQLGGALWPLILLILVLLLLFLLALPSSVLTYSYILVFTSWTSADDPPHFSALVSFSDSRPVEI